jgi:hypothetical protein
MKANPYVITFAEGADRGPAHLLGMLVEYAVELRKNGDLIVSGIVVDADPETDKLCISPWTKDDKGHEYPSSDVVFFDIYNDFDEVVYL